jgi:hypothetical protein
LLAGVPPQGHSRAGEFNREIHEPHGKILNAKYNCAGAGENSGKVSEQNCRFTDQGLEFDCEAAS